MLLESLLQLVETLSRRINLHGSALRQSEALTRYTLIDPLLRELGWDTSNPDMVIPEYRSGNGRADYALIINNSPMMMVEAKSLGTPLRDSVLAQGINYCLMEGTSYFSVTDGRFWDIYETHKPVPINDKRIVQFDLKGDPSQVCLNALALWRSSVQTGKVTVGQTPLLKQTLTQLDIQQTRDLTFKAPSASPSTDENSWQALTNVTPAIGKNPTEVLFPDNSAVGVSNWRNVTVEVVRWLTAKGLLSAAHCPIKSSNPGAFRHMVHTQPIHSNGAKFKFPIEVNGLYVERHDNNLALRNKTVTIIEHVGQEPSYFKLRLP